MAKIWICQQYTKEQLESAQWSQYDSVEKMNLVFETQDLKYPQLQKNFSMTTFFPKENLFYLLVIG